MTLPEYLKPSLRTQFASEFINLRFKFEIYWRGALKLTSIFLSALGHCLCERHLWGWLHHAPQNPSIPSRHQFKYLGTFDKTPRSSDPDDAPRKESKGSYIVWNSLKDFKFAKLVWTRCSPLSTAVFRIAWVEENENNEAATLTAQDLATTAEAADSGSHQWMNNHSPVRL